MTQTDNEKIYDLLVIGGGVNGCGIAADAAGRSLSTVLCEQYDLANETSSRSSKMIHGGLRYLEYYEFRLVREALSEREVMLRIAPHLVQPLQLIIPHNKKLRPAWMVRLGLFLYDHLGRKTTLPRSYGLKFTDKNQYDKPLKTDIQKGFCYYDCKVDDARLVVLNAKAAQHHGAVILPRTKLIAAERHGDVWISTLKDNHNGNTWQVKSLALANAAGPWVSRLINNTLNMKTKHHVQLVKGSHIVIPKFYDGDHAYLIQHEDKRVVFVAPYHNDFTMIGTTDIPYDGDPATVTIDDDEKQYLCDLVNQYFKQSIAPTDIVNDWSGVRPLQADESDNPSAVTRDYALEVEDLAGKAPILSVFGGKITTYRELAEHAMQKLAPYFSNMGPAWTATTPLPGGKINSAKQYGEKLHAQFPFLDKVMLQRYAHSYGALANTILQGVSSVEDLGQNFGHSLYAKEVDYLVQHEWAQTAEDILWRRSKLGLFKIDQAALETYLSSLSDIS